MLRVGPLDLVIVSAHQPHFLPWSGYFNKALRSDVFVWLHTVQYRKNYYQNRTRIRNETGGALWLTLPVHAHLGMPIDEVRLVSGSNLEKICRTLEQCYRKAPFFGDVWPSLRRALEEPVDRLEALNYQSFQVLLELLGGGPRVVRAGDLGVDASDPSERLVAFCRALGATRYIAGRGGRGYMRPEIFEESGIEVVWQDFDPESVVYPQVGPGFLPGLSLVDSLFCVGPNETRNLIEAAWRPIP